MPTGTKLRLFVGIPVEESLRHKLAEVRAQLTPSVGRIRWVAKENIHLTLKFLGPVEEAKVALITDALYDACRNCGKFRLSVRGLGVFPDLRRARILWAGLDGQGLGPLVQSVEQRLESVGFERERRPFHPHLTLGRWRVPEKDLSLIRAALENRADEGLGDFSVNAISLFRSDLCSTGAVHTVLKRFDLKGENG